jgi:hypothetical protein
MLRCAVYVAMWIHIDVIKSFFYVGYWTTLSVSTVSSADRRMTNYELWRIWKEAVMAYSKCYPSMYQEGLKKHENLTIAGVPSQIRTAHLPYTSVEYYYYASPFGVI